MIRVILLIVYDASPHAALVDFVTDDLPRALRDAREMPATVTAWTLPASRPTARPRRVRVSA